MVEERYNLLMSGNEEAWDNDSYILDLDRFLEHTEKDLKSKFSKLDSDLINEIKTYPCIFAYENSCHKDAYIGYITDVIVRQNKIKIIFRKDDMITTEDIRKLQFELDISDWEFSRTHWAIKKVNLYKEFQFMCTSLKPLSKPIDITKQIFDVAFTFAGESRSLVEQVVRELERTIQKDSIFYDNNFVSQLARPSLDTLLQDIYRNRSRLIVVFLCEKYQEKKWCGLEFRAIKELIMEKEISKIMYIRLDDGQVDGVFKTDGYVDGMKFTPKELSRFINERISLI